MSKKPDVTLSLNAAADRVVVNVANRSKDAITIVTHPRYLVFELLDERGQFVRGVEAGAGMPSKKDFLDIPSGQEVPAFELVVERSGNAVTIGTTTFSAVPDGTALRVTYKPDALVPNLPSSKRRSFFRGPMQSERVEFG